MLTERKIISLKHSLNSGTITLDEIHAQIGLPQTLEDSHTYKGLAWMIKQKSLKNSPFGNREDYIIENFAKFELIDFVDTYKYKNIADMNHWYQPVYRVYSNNGSHFDYYYDFIKVYICG